MKGIESGIKGQLSAPLTKAGKQAGQDMGNAVAAGLEQAKGRVEKASAALAKARDKEADAAGKVRVAEKQLEDLRGNSRATAGRIVAAEEKIAKAKRDSAQASRDAAKADKDLGGAKSNFANLGKGNGAAMGGGLMDGVSGAVSKLGGKAGPIGMALTAVVGLGLGVGSMLMGAITDGMQKETRQDLLQAQLGVNPEAAAKIGDAAGAAYGNVFGESVAANMDAAKAAIQSGLLTGEEDTAGTQAMIEKLQTVSQIMGEDIPDVARAAGQSIKTGMARDGAGALDQLVVATQKGLNVNNDLLDTYNEYGTQFRKLGLDGPDAMGLVSQAVKNGARDTDVAADAIKEFSIRSVDGSKTTTEGFQTLGLNAQDMAEKIGKGGESARDAFGQVLDKIRAIKDPVERSQVAVKLFGTQAEDLGGALGAMDLHTAVQQFGDVEGAAQRAADTIGDNAATKIEGAKRSIEMSSTAIKGALAEAFGPALEKVATWVSTHQSEIIGFFQDVGDTAFVMLDAVLAVSEGVLRAFATMEDAVGTVLGGMTVGIGNFANALGDVVSVIPGMDDIGKKLQKVGDVTADAGRSMMTWGDETRRMADGIGGARQGLQGLMGDFDDSADAAQHAAEIAEAFGGAVEEIPGSKDVKVKALTEEGKRLIDEFNLKVTTLADGTSIIHADTDPGQLQIDNWVGRITSAPINMKVYAEMLTAPPGTTQGPLTTDQILNPGGHARGGRISGRGTGTSDSIPALLSNGEFVVNAASARRNMPLLEIINRRKYAAGGVVSADDLANFAKGVEGAPYEWGGVHWGDCSGAVAALANYATGRDPWGSRFATGSEGSELAARGFKSGLGPAGSLNIGWNNGGPGGGHTSATLPNGAHFEMGGARGDGQYGGSAMGAGDSSHTDFAYLPPEFFKAAGGDVPTGTGGDKTGTGDTSGDASGQFTAPENETPEQKAARLKQEGKDEQAKDYDDARKKWGENWGKAGESAAMGQAAGTPFENAANKGQTVVNFVQKDLTEAFDKWKRYQGIQAAAAGSRL